jgi:hypothetical protein
VCFPRMRLITQLRFAREKTSVIVLILTRLPAWLAPSNLLPPRHSISQRGDRAMQNRLETIQTISKIALIAER